MLSSEPRIAFIQDALPFWGGAESVLGATLELFPKAPVYTLVYNPKAFENTTISQRKIHTSFINRFPAARTNYRNYLPLFPLAIEQFDLRDYDILFSFSYAVAHGVLPRPEQHHISYTFAPLRYAWHNYHEYVHGKTSGLKASALKILLHYLRYWDASAASRVDTFIAPSRWVSRCIWRAYRRRARVIYPSVDTHAFRPYLPRSEYYVAVSRMSPHKKVSLIVEAFARLGLPLLVIGDGVEFQQLSKRITPNIQLLGRQPGDTVRELLEKAKGFVHAAEEDFGIAMVEAQAAGCPVIAYAGGGASETVIQGKTGLLYKEQSVECLVDAIEAFEASRDQFKPEDLCDNARRFCKENYQKNILELVEREWLHFQSREGQDEH